MEFFVQSLGLVFFFFFKSQDPSSIVDFVDWLCFLLRFFASCIRHVYLVPLFVWCF